MGRGLDAAISQRRDLLFPYELLFPVAEEQSDGAKTAGEQCGQGSLHPVVVEQGQQAVDRPGDGQREPDERAPHDTEITSRHCFNAADTLPAWLPQL